MNIIYKNYVAQDYTILHTPDTDEIFFCSTDNFSESWERTIVLSKDPVPSSDDESSLSTPNLCEELINVKDIEDALAFTKKYGALINTRLFKPPFSERSSPSSISGIINYECGFSSDCPFDLVLYKHFMFYQHDLYYLQLIHSKLCNPQQNISSAQFIINLLIDTAHLLMNPYLNYARYMEIVDPDINEIVNDSFPYAKFRFYIDDILHPPYAIKSDNDSSKAENEYNLHNIDFQHIFDIIQEQDVNIFPETFPYGHFLDAINNPDQSEDYWLDGKELIIQFADLLYKDILAFHLREIPPYSNTSAESTELAWEFPSLAHAIFFDFNNQIIGNSTYKICANKECRRIFLCKGYKIAIKIYCCNRCARNTTNRKSATKQRKNKKSKVGN